MFSNYFPNDKEQIKEVFNKQKDVIINSQLLLDEDISLLLESKRTKLHPNFLNGLSISLACGSISVLLIKRPQLVLKLLGSIVVVPTIRFLAFTTKTLLYRRVVGKTINKLICSLKSIESSLKDIRVYLKKFIDKNVQNEEFNLLNNSNCCELIRLVIENQIKVLSVLKLGISTISPIIQSFDIAKINDEFSTPTEFTSFMDCFSIFNLNNSKIILYQSDFLTMLVLYFESMNTNFNREHVSKFILNNLPDIADAINKASLNLKHLFVQYSSKKRTINIEKLGVNQKNSLNKRLRMTVINATSNVAIALDHYQDILSKLDHLSDKNKVEILQKEFMDLSLDLKNAGEDVQCLIKICNVILNKNKPCDVKPAEKSDETENTAENKVQKSNSEENLAFNDFDEFEAFIESAPLHFECVDTLSEEIFYPAADINSELKRNKEFIDRQKRFKVSKTTSEKTSNSLKIDDIRDDAKLSKNTKIENKIPDPPPIPGNILEEKICLNIQTDTMQPPPPPPMPCKLPIYPENSRDKGVLFHDFNEVIKQVKPNFKNDEETFE